MPARIDPPTLSQRELRDPLRLPGRLLAASEATVGAAQLPPRLPALVIARLDSLERGLQEVVGVLPEFSRRSSASSARSSPRPSGSGASRTPCIASRSGWRRCWVRCRTPPSTFPTTAPAVRSTACAVR